MRASAARGSPCPPVASTNTSRPGKLIADPSVVELAKTLDRLDRDGYELAGKARQLMLGRELMSPRGAVTPVWVRKKLEITKAQADDLLETLVASGALVTDGKDYMRP